MTFRAPVTGAVDVAIEDGRFVLEAGVSALLEVAVDELCGSERLLDGEMRRTLDAQRYPRARAAITAARDLGADRYELTGELTLRGRTRALTGVATVRLAGEQLHASGSITIDIRDFGIKPPSLLVVRVQPDVQLDIELSARRSDG
jgi:polyisoprenoid-binding protein YceI